MEAKITVICCRECGASIHDAHGNTKRCMTCRERIATENRRVYNERSSHKKTVTRIRARNKIFTEAREQFGSKWFKTKHLSRQLNRPVSGLTLAALVRDGKLERRSDTKSSYYRIVFDRKYR